MYRVPCRVQGPLIEDNLSKYCYFSKTEILSNNYVLWVIKPKGWRVILEYYWHVWARLKLEYTDGTGEVPVEV